MLHLNDDVDLELEVVGDDQNEVAHQTQHHQQRDDAPNSLLDGTWERSIKCYKDRTHYTDYMYMNIMATHRERCRRAELRVTSCARRIPAAVR